MAVFKSFLLITLIGLNFACSSAQHSIHQSHNNSRMGTHGMVLFSFADQLYLSHLPLARSKHDQQIIMAVKSSEKWLQLKQFAANNKLITIVPKPFDLALLMQGNISAINADVYIGHFERGGKQVLSDVAIKISKPILIKTIVRKETGHFYPVLRAQNSIVVAHQISEQTSFDQLLSLTCQDYDFDIITLASKPYLNNQIGKRINQRYQCRLDKILYTETQDFK